MIIVYTFFACRMNEMCAYVVSCEKFAINSVANPMIESRSKCNLKRCISRLTKENAKMKLILAIFAVFSMVSMVEKISSFSYCINFD